DDEIEYALVMVVGGGKAEHPARVEERRFLVRIVGIPFGEPLRVVRRTFAAVGESDGERVAKFPVSGAQGFLVLVAAGSEVVMADLLKLSFQLPHAIRAE